MHAVGQTPPWPGGGVGLSCDSPPPMMDWKSVALSAADHRVELKRLIPTEPLSLHHPSTRWNLEPRGPASFLKVCAETWRQLDRPPLPRSSDGRGSAEGG